MIHLSWNVARSLKLRDHTLYSHLRSLLESSLSHTQRLLKNLERAGIPVVWHGKEEGDQAPCCSYCLVCRSGNRVATAWYVGLGTG